MKHVAYIIPTLDRIGGAEQQVTLLATGLARRGWRVSVIALGGAGGDAAQKLESAGIAFRSLGMRKGLVDPRGWIRFHRWIKQNCPDIVHAHLPHASLLARWSRLAAPVRVLIDTIHSPAKGGVFRRVGYSASVALPDVVTAVSRAAADPWVDSGMVNENRLAIIPNGVDIDRWKRDDRIRQAMRAQLRLTNEFLWLSVGRLDPVKDHSTLLRAFTLLPSEARLVIVGDGRLKNQLCSLVRELGLSGRVHLPGFQTEVLPWMCAADSFVLCSRWEGLPMALLEAGACRLPVVITDIPGAQEVLPDSQCHRAIPSGDASALAAAMEEVMRQPDSERHGLGREIEQSVCERFSFAAVLNRWENLYDLRLENNPRPSRFGTSAPSLGRTLQLQ
jgi:glycosyltransferase involved in cell wall biosynthesis